MPRFAAIGLDHRHVYDLTAGLLAAGAVCVGHDPDNHRSARAGGVSQALPACPGGIARTAARRSLHRLHRAVRGAARPRRAGDRGDAARQGRDGGQAGRDDRGATCRRRGDGARNRPVLVDLPWAGWPRRRCRRRCASSRSGELGRLVSLTSLAPHRLNRALRPAWFFERDGLWRDHQRYRRALDRPVPGVRRGCRCDHRGQHDRRVSARRRRVRGFRRDHAAHASMTGTCASTGSRRMGCRTGATGGCSWSAPKARWNCGRTWISRAGRAATTCSSRTGSGPATRTAARCR